MENNNLENRSKNGTQALADKLIEFIEEADEQAEVSIEKADLVEMLADDLLSDLGKRNLAIYLLRQCGRSDLAESIQEETASSNLMRSR